MTIDHDPVVARRHEAGFSLIEVLIASVLLLFILIGVLPLFSRSMMNNIQGNDASNVANAAIDNFETLFTVPFNNDLITVPVGETVVERQQFFSLKTNQWLAVIPVGDQAQYTRTLRLRQYSFADIADDGEFTTPLDGGTEPGNVQFKEFEMEVGNDRSVGAPPFRARALQAF